MLAGKPPHVDACQRAAVGASLLLLSDSERQACVSVSVLEPLRVQVEWPVYICASLRVYMNRCNPQGNPL